MALCVEQTASWDVYIVQYYKNQYCTNLISPLISQAYRLLTLQGTAGRRSQTLFQFIHYDGISNDPGISQKTSLSTFSIRLRNIFMTKWLENFAVFKKFIWVLFPLFQNENFVCVKNQIPTHMNYIYFVPFFIFLLIYYCRDAVAILSLKPDSQVMCILCRLCLNTFTCK